MRNVIVLIFLMALPMSAREYFVAPVVLVMYNVNVTVRMAFRPSPETYIWMYT